MDDTGATFSETPEFEEVSPAEGEAVAAEEQAASSADVSIPPAPQPVAEVVLEPTAAPAPEPAAEAVPEPAPAPEPVAQSRPSLVIPGTAPAAAPAGTPVAAEPQPAPAEPSLDDMVAQLRDGSSDGISDAPVPADGGEAGPEAVAEGDAESAEAGEVTPAAPFSESEIEPVELIRASKAARVPFWVYGGAWAVFAIAVVAVMWPHAAGPFVEVPIYGVFVLLGAALAIAAPVLALIVWLVTKDRDNASERDGLARALTLRMAVSMLAGVVLWWVALIVLDLHRAGTI